MVCISLYLYIYICGIRTPLDICNLHSSHHTCMHECIVCVIVCVCVCDRANVFVLGVVSIPNQCLHIEVHCSCGGCGFVGLGCWGFVALCGLVHVCVCTLLCVLGWVIVALNVCSHAYVYLLWLPRCLSRACYVHVGCDCMCVSVIALLHVMGCVLSDWLFWEVVAWWPCGLAAVIAAC